MPWDFRHVFAPWGRRLRWAPPGVMGMGPWDHQHGPLIKSDMSHLEFIGYMTNSSPTHLTHLTHDSVISCESNKNMKIVAVTIAMCRVLGGMLWIEAIGKLGHFNCSQTSSFGAKSKDCVHFISLKNQWGVHRILRHTMTYPILRTPEELHGWSQTWCPRCPSRSSKERMMAALVLCPISRPSQKPAAIETHGRRKSYCKQQRILDISVVYPVG